MADVVGSAMGPLAYGLGFDLFGGYNQLILFSMIFPAMGVASALLATKPIKSMGSNIEA
jgi:hypothetical protein